MVGIHPALGIIKDSLYHFISTIYHRRKGFVLSTDRLRISDFMRFIHHGDNTRSGSGIQVSQQRGQYHLISMRGNNPLPLLNFEGFNSCQQRLMISVVLHNRPSLVDTVAAGNQTKAGNREDTG
ncbi:hypothetical protein EDC52_101417 [Biostraticola tofi]|uniref:Uncharacterized protein n=1 Tax=Biostraticola tofi TaxID=466109 RepID=A0A4R3Z4G9_9GAMM|nr:hypothetical protein EDC52_101417 [Biostraticola tofi]